MRIYKYPKSSTARLLDLKEGGSGGLKNFLLAYKKEARRFGGPGLTQPVVILYDNDDGASAVRNVIKSTFKVPSTGAEPFVHVFKTFTRFQRRSDPAERRHALRTSSTMRSKLGY